jgi:hypothetical protein
MMSVGSRLIHTSLAGGPASAGASTRTVASATGPVRLVLPHPGATLRVLAP